MKATPAHERRRARYLQHGLRRLSRAIQDAIQEARLNGPLDFARALRFIPSEFHGRESSLEDRFVAAVDRNARAAKRLPYTVALFALDFA